MKRALVGFTAVLALCTVVHAASLPPSQMPMYGNLEKPRAMKDADASLIASVAKRGYTRQDGAIELIQTAWKRLHKGDYANAVMRFNQAWILDPENGDTYYGFALVSMRRDKDTKAAEKFFRLALSKANVSSSAYIDYGNFLWSNNRLDEGLEHLYKTLGRWPRARNARSTIALIYYKKNDYVRACQWAKSAMENRDQLKAGFLDDACTRAYGG